MIAFIAGAEFVAIVVLCAVVYGQRCLVKVLVAGMLHSERKCRAWKEHLEAVVFQTEDSTLEDAKYTADVTERRIEAELAGR